MSSGFWTGRNDLANAPWHGVAARNVVAPDQPGCPDRTRCPGGRCPLGAPAVRKTTLALEIAVQRPSVYLDLERNRDRLVLADPDLYLEEQVGKHVILEKIPQALGLFKILRGQVDMQRHKGARTGQFLLPGLASIMPLTRSAESLAGRARYIEMPPLLLFSIAQMASPGNRLSATGLQPAFADLVRPRGWPRRSERDREPRRRQPRGCRADGRPPDALADAGYERTHGHDHVADALRDRPGAAG